MPRLRMIRCSGCYGAEGSTMAPAGLELDNAVLSALRRLIRAADLDARDLARQTGLSTSQLLVLELLDATGELTVGSIAREVGLAQGTVTSLIDRLVERGLLCRRRAQDLLYDRLFLL